MVALGPTIAGLFSNDKRLASALIECGRQGGEKYWNLPLERSYEDQLKSLVADTVNTGMHELE